MNTEIIVILDRSGSMGSIAAEAIAGYNMFLEEQRLVPGQARVTRVQFDNLYQIDHQAIPLASSQPLDRRTFVPRGMTALNDAIGRTLEEQGRRIAQEGWAEKAVVCILTDGAENASREYTAPRIKQMIEHAQNNAGWVFVFLAANQDAFVTGAGYGIAAATTANFAANAAGTQSAYQTISAHVTRARTTGLRP